MDLPLLLSEFGDFTLFSQFDRYKTNFSNVNSSQIFITFKDDQNLIVKQKIKDLNMQKVVHAPAPAACRLLSCFRLLAACLLLLSPPTVLPCRCLLPKDGFGSDTDEIGSECHLLPHFNPDTNANADLIGYEYKTDSSNPDSDPDTFSI